MRSKANKWGEIKYLVCVDILLSKILQIWSFLRDREGGRAKGVWLLAYIFFFKDLNFCPSLTLVLFPAPQDSCLWKISSQKEVEERWWEHSMSSPLHYAFLTTLNSPAWNVKEKKFCHSVKVHQNIGLAKIERVIVLRPSRSFSPSVCIGIIACQFKPPTSPFALSLNVVKSYRKCKL